MMRKGHWPGRACQKFRSVSETGPSGGILHEVARAQKTTTAKAVIVVSGEQGRRSLQDQVGLTNKIVALVNVDFIASLLKFSLSGVIDANVSILPLIVDFAGNACYLWLTVNGKRAAFFAGKDGSIRRNNAEVQGFGTRLDDGIFTYRKAGFEHL